MTEKVFLMAEKVFFNDRKGFFMTEKVFGLARLQDGLTAAPGIRPVRNKKSIFPAINIQTVFREISRKKLFETIFFEPGWRKKLFRDVDLIAAIRSVFFSSKSELSSRFFGQKKCFVLFEYLSLHKCPWRTGEGPPSPAGETPWGSTMGKHHVEAPWGSTF